MKEGGTERKAASLARRRVLRGLATGGVAAGLVGASRAVAEETTPQSAADTEGDHRRIGFRPTEHTRWFYHRARW